MPRMLYVAALALLLTACSSDGDRYSAPTLREVTAANQCMDQCQRQHDSCMTRRSGFGSGDNCGTGVATQRDARCEKLDNPELRRSCEASADYCRNRLPALTCGENRSRCMATCGG
jgi:hypothetical protein